MGTKSVLSAIVLLWLGSLNSGWAGCIGEDGQWEDISSCASRPCPNGKTRNEEGSCVCLPPKSMVGIQCKAPTPPNNDGGGATGGSGGGPTNTPAQPLVLLGGDGLLTCPPGAVDCADCPADTGPSDSASCGASAFSNYLVESMSRQASSNTVSDENIRAASALGGEHEGVH